MHKHGMLGDDGDKMMEGGEGESVDQPRKPNVAKVRKHLMMALNALMGDDPEHRYDDTDY